MTQKCPIQKGEEIDVLQNCVFAAHIHIGWTDLITVLFLMLG